MEPLVIIPSAAESMSSGSGISYWMDFYECPRRTRLDKEYGDNWGVDEEGEQKLDLAKVGVLVHKLMEFYYQGMLTEGVAFEYVDGNTDPEWVEALRLFQAYRKIYPPNEWEVVSTEQPIAFGDPLMKGASWISPLAQLAPEVVDNLGPQALDAIAEVGVPYLTGRYDMIVRVSEEHVAVLKESRKITLQPGIYIVDTKTKSQKGATMTSDFLESVQFHTYMKLFKILHPDLYPELQGTLANVLIRYQELDMEKRAKKKWSSPFHTIFIPRSNFFKEEMVRGVLNEAWRRRTLLGADHTNAKMCQGYGRECPHLNVLCPRY